MYVDTKPYGYKWARNLVLLLVCFEKNILNWSSTACTWTWVNCHCHRRCTKKSIGVDRFKPKRVDKMPSKKRSRLIWVITSCCIIGCSGMVDHHHITRKTSSDIVGKWNIFSFRRKPIISSNMLHWLGLLWFYDKIFYIFLCQPIFHDYFMYRMTAELMACHLMWFGMHTCVCITYTYIRVWIKRICPIYSG